VVGISADVPARNLAWARELNLPFRLLSDVSPAGEVGRRFGVWDETWRIQRRTTFVVDRHARIRWLDAGGSCIETRRTLEAVTRLARTR
jgi:peroxiredoxin